MPTLAPPESIYGMIKRLSAKHVSPADVATALIAEIQHDPERVLTVLRRVLPSYCRIVINGQRREVPPPPEPRPDDDVIIKVSKPEPGQPKVISVKNQLLREWRDKVFGAAYYVGPGVGRRGWLTLGDLTYENVQYGITSYRNLAVANSVEAERLERLAAAMTWHKVERVNELPVELVADIMRHVS